MSSRILPIQHVSQGDTPFCTYASVSMILKYFGIHKSVQKIASEIITPNFPFRGEDDWPTDGETYGQVYSIIQDYLHDHGLKAKFYRNQGWEKIKKHIDRRHALLTLVRSQPEVDQPDHSWVLRGYNEGQNLKDVIFNDPAKDLAGNDPMTFDPDGDFKPGMTMDFQEFVFNHWSCEIDLVNQEYLAVSFKDLDMDSESVFDWRGTNQRNVAKFVYHSTRLTDKVTRGEFVEAFFESVMVGIGFVGFTMATVQIAGQYLEKWGKGIIDQGVKWCNSKGIGWKALGVVTVLFGVPVAALGYVLDFIGGVVGGVVEAAHGFVDAIGSIFTGSASGGKTKKLGDLTIDLGVVLHVRPWKSRILKNWEKISGVWYCFVRSGPPLDKLEISWKVQIWGWGLDSWSLSREIYHHGGTVVKNVKGNCTNHVKRFEAELTDSDGLNMGYGENKCHYGKDGGMTRVQCKVEAWATYQGETKKITKKVNSYGVSTLLSYIP